MPNHATGGSVWYGTYSLKVLQANVRKSVGAVSQARCVWRHKAASGPGRWSKAINTKLATAQMRIAYQRDAVKQYQLP